MKRPVLNLAIGLMLAFFSSSVFAATTDYTQWKPPGYGIYFNDVQGVCTWHAALKASQGSAYETCDTIIPPDEITGWYRLCVLDLTNCIAYAANEVSLTCTDPEIPNDGGGLTCVAPPDCGDTLGDRISNIFAGDIDAAPSTIDSGGCQYEQEVCAQLGGGGDTACTYVGNGQLATGGEGDGSGATAMGGGGADQQCVSGGGQQICYSPTGVNQGTINGEFVDATTISEDTITFLPGGSTLVGENAPSPTNSDGSPATGTGSISWADPTTGTATNFEYFQNGGGQTSTSSADAATAGATQATADGVEELVKKHCGGVGEPPCDVKVDETGTPDGSTFEAESLSKIDGTGIQGLIDGLANPLTPEQSDINPVLPAYTSGCQTISMSWAGTSVDFPSASQCAKLGIAKDMIGYLLYFLTAVLLFGIATRSSSS